MVELGHFVSITLSQAPSDRHSWSRTYTPVLLVISKSQGIMSHFHPMLEVTCDITVGCGVEASLTL